MINPKTNKEKFILEVLEDLHYLYKVPDNYKNKENKEIILEIIERHPVHESSFLSYLDSDLRDDKEVVLATVKKNAYTLMYASDRLKDDYFIVFEAVNRSGAVLTHASHRLKDDKDIVLTAVKEYGVAIEYASDKLKDDREIALEAVKNESFAFAHLSDRLKNDKEIAIIALKKNGYLFEKMSQELRQDKELMRKAYIQKTAALKYFPEEIQKEVKGLIPNQVVKYLEVLMLKESLENELPNQENKPKKLKL
jgi:hypothetical protein